MDIIIVLWFAYLIMYVIWLAIKPKVVREYDHHRIIFKNNMYYPQVHTGMQWVYYCRLYVEYDTYSHTERVLFKNIVDAHYYIINEIEKE